MKRFVAATGFALLFVPSVLARTRETHEQREQSLLARVTVYWASGGRGSDSHTRRHKSSTGVRLRVGHCAVDPRRDPLRQQSRFVRRRLHRSRYRRRTHHSQSARRAGRTASERNALVIDRFFETKRQALSWANAHPAFMTVQVFRRILLVQQRRSLRTRRASSSAGRDGKCAAKQSDRKSGGASERVRR